MRIRLWLLLTLVPLLLLAACGTPDTPSQTRAESMPASTATPAATRTPSLTTEPTATLAPTVDPATLAQDVNDTAQLDENSAPQEPIEVQPATYTASQPVRIQIPAINLDYAPVSVGLDQNRVPVVLKHDIGWYNLSAMPGQGENIVFWGHVLRFVAAPNIPAPFARVKELQPGAEIVITNANGEVFRYAVTQAVSVTPDQVQYIMPTGKEQVTLVSCIGDKVIVNGGVTKTHRLVTIAEPIR
jgi:LPXTG-site transpeptidase (sortase) family protein